VAAIRPIAYELTGNTNRCPLRRRSNSPSRQRLHLARRAARPLVFSPAESYGSSSLRSGDHPIHRRERRALGGASYQRNSSRATENGDFPVSGRLREPNRTCSTNSSISAPSAVQTSTPNCTQSVCELKDSGSMSHEPIMFFRVHFGRRFRLLS
jgi:hypothetical protein